MHFPRAAYDRAVAHWLPLVHGDPEAAHLAAFADRARDAHQRARAALTRTDPGAAPMYARHRAASLAADDHARTAAALAEHLDSAPDVHPDVLALARPDLTTTTAEAA